MHDLMAHPVEKSQNLFQKFSQKQQEGRLGKVGLLSQLQYTYNPSQNRVKQLKGKDPKNKITSNSTEHIAKTPKK